MKTYLSRKEAILLTAIEILDDTGMQGLTIKEIASRQNITEAAIYRHFKSKQEILIAVLEKFSYFDMNIKNTIMDQKMDVRAGILFYVTSYVEYYQNYPAITSLLFAYDMLRDEKDALSMTEKITDDRISFLSDFIKEAQGKGEISQTISADNMSFALWGTLREIIHMWRRSGYDFSLKGRVLEFVNQFLEVV